MLDERVNHVAARHDVGQPAVSVVIPTRNRWGFLRRALESVLAQEDVTVEVLVVDDGSADEPPDWLRAQEAAERVRVLRRPFSGGVASARNTGIRAARAEWIAFLDDDDVWAPDKLRRQLAIATADVAFIYTGAFILDETAAVVGRIHPAPPGRLDPAQFEDNLVGTPSSVLARADAVRATGGFDESLNTLADWDMWIRLLTAGRAALCPEPLVGYTLHSGNMHIGDGRALRREIGVLRTKHRSACRERGVRLGGPLFARWLIDSYRRAGMRRQAAWACLSAGVRHRRLGDLVRAVVVLWRTEPIRRRPFRRDVGPSAETLERDPTWLVELRALDTGNVSG